MDIMIQRGLALFLLFFALLSAPLDAQTRRKPPYWASIASGQAMMRTGPGRNYPGTWLYVRRDLPVRVVGIHESWRKVQDPDGTTGWMLVHLLSDARTAIVQGEGVRTLHEQPDERAPIRYRVEPGVVGQISRCRDGWCRMDVGQRGGFIRIDQIWGVGPEETLD